MAIATQQPRRAYIDLPSGQLHYREIGEGEPLLLLHQTPSSSLQWEAAYPLLAAAGMRVIAPDTPGYGMSDPPAGTPTAEGYAAAALAFHEHIVDAAANKPLARLLGSVYAQIQAMRAHSSSKDFPTRMPHSVENHERILDAITARDPERAEREARTHIQRLGEEIKSQAARGNSQTGV